MFIHFFPYIGNNHPNWQTHIFQRGRSTTNQMVFEVCLLLLPPPSSSSSCWWWWLYCPDIPIQQNLSIHEICLSLVHFRPLQPPKPTWMYYSKWRSLVGQTPGSKNMVLSENWVSPKAFWFVGLVPRNFGVKLHFLLHVLTNSKTSPASQAVPAIAVTAAPIQCPPRRSDGGPQKLGCKGDLSIKNDDFVVT